MKTWACKQPFQKRQSNMFAPLLTNFSEFDRLFKEFQKILFKAGSRIRQKTTKIFGLTRKLNVTTKLLYHSEVFKIKHARGRVVGWAKRYLRDYLWNSSNWKWSCDSDQPRQLWTGKLGGEGRTAAPLCHHRAPNSWAGCRCCCP